jgi:pyridoxine/pyridoxamine 5'-phosphate oxidase
MQMLYDVLKYSIPALIVLATAYLLLKTYLDGEAARAKLQSQSAMQQSTIPVRLQAYERLVLLLERIEPASLLIRQNVAGASAMQLQTALLDSVRAEFEHNLSQQLYVSGHAWELVRNAQLETVKRINTAASKLAPEATSADLVSAILLGDIELPHSAVKHALDYVKAEARNNFF